MKRNLFTPLAALALGLAVSACGGAADQGASGKDAAIQNIMTRTSIRKFDGKPVAEADIDVMLKAGMAAPTARNKQPWDFVVVDDKTALDSLNAAMGRSPIANGCPLAIIVCGNLEKAGEGLPFWVQDASAASENILLAANALGLGAVWCSGYPGEAKCAAVSKAVGLPSYVQPLSIICIGHPAEAPTPKDKWKAENVHRNRF